MITWVDVLAIVFVAGLAALGIWRGFVREILVSLAGIVLGVFAGSLWATSWGGAWASGLGMNEAVLKGIILLVSLYGIVLIIGYGSSLFLRRRPIPLWQRLVGGLIGLLNGLVLAALTLSYIQDHFLGAAPDSVLRKSLLSAALIDWLPVILAGIVLVVVLAVIVVAIVRLVRFISRLVQEPAPAPAAAPVVVAAAPAPAAPEPAPAPPPAGPTVLCPNCGNTVPGGSGFCPQCGKTLP